MGLSEKIFTEAFSRKGIDSKYDKSPKGKERRRRWRQSISGIARRREQSRRYILSGKSAIAQRSRYHEIQDEAGCHYKVEDFYPGYRFLKALETAEIIDD